MAAPPRQQIAWAQKYGKQYGVDPRLLLAIGGHETQWGTLGAGRQGYTLGYGVTDSGILSKYRGPENQYRYAAQTLASWGAKTLQDVLAGKASSYATDPAWEQGVASIYKGLPQLGTAPTSPVTGTVPSSTAPPTTRTSSLMTTTPFAPAPLAAIPGHILDAVNRSLAGALSPALGGPASPGSVKPLELAKFVPRTPAPIRPLPVVAGTKPPTTTPPVTATTKSPTTNLTAPIKNYPLGVRGKIIGTPYAGTHTLYGNWESDRAVDIAAPVGTAVYAPFAGTIGSQIGALGGNDPRLLGLRVHVDGVSDSAYLAHLSRLVVKAGQRVKAGQLIGYSGSANGVAHLHFATKNRDPRTYTGR